MAQQKKPIVLAVLIPMVMIALVAASIYLPRLYVHPQYGFLYYASYCGIFEIKDKLVESIPADRLIGYCDQYKPDEMSFFVYDVRTGASKEINLEAARKLRIDKSKISPDGFEVVESKNNNDYSPFYYDSDDYKSEYLKGKGTTFRVHLPDKVTTHNFKFLGWVIE